jgi:hypothetical protein
MTMEELNHDSLMDLSLQDFDILHCENVGKNEIEDICQTCKYNIGICQSCDIHADNFAYVENGKGIIVHCNMWERKDLQ